MFNTILIVCVGNICRSPSAERILQKLMPIKEVNSAGIATLLAHNIEPNAAKLLAANNYNSESHCAKQVTSQMINDADLVLVMERKHQRLLMQSYPSASGKIMLLGKWSDNQEIHDPYRKSLTVFEYTFTQIEKNCQAWTQKLLTSI
jgi:protein-tyrosine phosphatase